jgi:single-strand DNA-binding protein
MATLTGLFTIGRNAELRATSGGGQVVQMSVAYNYGRKGEDGRKPSQWVKVSMFGKQAEALVPYLLKGKQVSLVIRELHVVTFEKQDRTMGVALEGVADFDDFARGQRQDDAAPASAPPPAARRPPAPSPAPAARPGGSSGFDDMDDDIPFRDPLARCGFHLAA